MKRGLLALMVLATPVAAQTPGEAAQQAAERLQSARTALEAAGGASDQVAALTQTVRAYEDGLIALRDGLRRVAVRQDTLALELDARQAEVSQLLGVLASIGNAPTPLLLLHPSGPLGTARSGMLVADVTPALQREVEALRAQTTELATLQALQEGAAQTLADGLQGAQEARAALSAAVSDRTDLPQRYTEDAVQTALLLASTDTLADFATALAGTVDVASPDLTPQGDLPLPVQGTVLRAFNTADAAGIVRPGVVIAARPQALVTTPVAATLLFRGPLLDYGNVVILEPAQDILFVIGGLADVYGEAGQVLPAGAPLGLLGGTEPAVDAILTPDASGSAAAATQTLYLEVRDGQGSVNPDMWFALD
ncbi:Septal ring factor EnvC, activator of murein hydrolases AmiA and AmiB [Loktanella fryxellensis]|uniref:Septal ring factor EnvC, activator of murein hydrolases AmiA and AmiB n=1 Tax=Loktanella fryxellensis TaxID=245187 RepID=A0A1H8EA81_9RHOB|nr:peptidase M23 [Loktanella fryxellensis]SEN16300.1 Septal ring factor EnvC, activator of murein hydrolases AmiA and AmiB [Loktanella fryxellensis]